MRIGFYAGSFDPFTVGHLHIVKIACGLFDKVVVGIGINSSKTRRFDKEKMRVAISKLLKSEGLTNAEVITFDGLTADVAKQCGASFLIRGLRNSMDYNDEENLALINKEISGLETIYLRSGNYGVISSTMVCELLKRGKDVSAYIPPHVIDVVTKKEEV